MQVLFCFVEYFPHFMPPPLGGVVVVIKVSDRDKQNKDGEGVKQPSFLDVLDLKLHFQDVK